MNIDQKTLSELLHLGGQYFLPVAALLRAIYAGFRGRFPEGFTQIGAASLFAGLTTAVDTGVLDWRVIALKVLGNTVFMAGLLSFIMLYLLKQPYRGRWFDGTVGGLIGLVAWGIWVPVLQNDWPLWTLPLVIIAGAVAFIALRFSLRQIIRLVRIATYLIVIGTLLIVAAGGFLLIQTLMARPV